MKCLPQNKIAQANGIVLHDWHAEILAIRSFNRFLLEECRSLALSTDLASEFVRVRTPEERSKSHFQPFAINDDIELHMYCSEAPCGDASMELTQAAQVDGEPWAVPAKASQTLSDESPSGPELHGRSYFSELGTIRRKPSRPDAPPTLSKSCSDKLALKQCTSLLSSPVSLLISPSNAYLKSFTLPKSQHSETGCQRAFSPEGRMSALKGKSWDGCYRYQSFEVKTTEKEFVYSRRHNPQPSEVFKSSNVSASWIGDGQKGSLETTINGTIQGRKQFDVRGASRVCKSSMLKLALEISALVAIPTIQRCLGSGTYGEMKRSQSLEGRQMVKREAWEKGLKGWIRNEGGEGFSIRS